MLPFSFWWWLLAGNDHHGNIAKAKSEGYALRLEWNRINERNLYEAISTLISDPRYYIKPQKKIDQNSWIKFCFIAVIAQTQRVSPTCCAMKCYRPKMPLFTGSSTWCDTGEPNIYSFHRDTCHFTKNTCSTFGFSSLLSSASLPSCSTQAPVVPGHSFVSVGKWKLNNQSQCTVIFF